MASQGPNSAGAGANQTGVGTVAWSDPGNVVASDNTRSFSGLLAGAQSNYLLASGFGFSIPDGSTIDGVVVEIEKSASYTGVVDNRVRIVKGGVVGATDKAAVGIWDTLSASEAYTTYGGASDKWGETWTAADINASDFGVAISARNNHPKFPRTAYVDHVRITVYYTEGASPPVAASATMGLMGVG